MTHDDAYSRTTDPWSSKEIEEIRVNLDLLDEIVAWLPSGTARACGYACGYAADFEITAAMLPFFPEVYEGAIRRQMRILRKQKRAVTVLKSEHQHLNEDTKRRSQCHRLPAPTPPPKRKRFIPRQSLDD